MATRHTRRVARTGRPIPGKKILAALFVERGGVMVDTIGLSAAALWAALPVTHRSIYLVDENTLRSAEDIIVNIEASEYYNNGEELVGNATKKAQYQDGTSEAVLRKAYRYFGIAYPEPSTGFPFTFPFNLG